MLYSFFCIYLKNLMIKLIIIKMKTFFLVQCTKLSISISDFRELIFYALLLTNLFKTYGEWRSATKNILSTYLFE